MYAYLCRDSLNASVICVYCTVYIGFWLTLKLDNLSVLYKLARQPMQLNAGKALTYKLKRHTMFPHWTT